MHYGICGFRTQKVSKSEVIRHASNTVRKNTDSYIARQSGSDFCEEICLKQLAERMGFEPTRPL